MSRAGTHGHGAPPRKRERGFSSTGREEKWKAALRKKCHILALQNLQKNSKLIIELGLDSDDSHEAMKAFGRVFNLSGSSKGWTLKQFSRLANHLERMLAGELDFSEAKRKYEERKHTPYTERLYSDFARGVREGYRGDRETIDLEKLREIRSLFDKLGYGADFRKKYILRYTGKEVDVMGLADPVDAEIVLRALGTRVK